MQASSQNPFCIATHSGAAVEAAWRGPDRAVQDIAAWVAVSTLRGSLGSLYGEGGIHASRSHW